MAKKTTFNIDDFQSNWITDKIDEDAIHYLEGLGIWLCDRNVVFNQQDGKYETDEANQGRTGLNAVSTSQIRNLFSEVKRIELTVGEDENKWEAEKVAFLLLKPKVAYNTARQKNQNSKMKDFKKVFEKAHPYVKEIKHLKNFSNFIEGIVAYHKAYGGR